MILLVLATLGGCVAERRERTPWPTPILGTRGPQYTRPIPPPQVVRPPAPPPRRTVPGVPTRIRAGTIVVDAGHGGHDPGALGTGPLPEKSVNLGVTRKLVRLLGARGARTATTRLDDRFLSLDARARFADRNRAALFVSIHADAARRSSASGATIYIARNALPESEQAGKAIADALKRAGVKVRGVRRAGFRVLVGHSRPAVLVECGFLTNPREAELLSQNWYQTRIAAAIAEGIALHFSR